MIDVRFRGQSGHIWLRLKESAYSQRQTLICAFMKAPTPDRLIPGSRQDLRFTYSSAKENGANPR